MGVGNSTNKKDAQSNAARDFIQYLVRTGELNAAEVPALNEVIGSAWYLLKLCVLW